MKKIVLSAMAALTLGSVAANAGTTKLYQDANGQVFTQAAEGRTAIKTPTPLFSKSSKIKFSGLTYLGYTYKDYNKNVAGSNVLNGNKDTSDFEIRRAYFQVKAYLLDNPKSYYRVTMDLTREASTANTNGSMIVRAKYAYLYLDNVLPSTGVEIGLAHRPWHDYEEHNSWYFRSINKVLIEDKVFGADLSNSADFGFLLKTKTKYFDADYGIFNGEGYHSANNGTGMSFEWRTTAHLMGVNGKEKQTTKTYWDASFFGQYNKAHKSVTVGAITEQQDLIFGGLHTVYNQPSFLVAAQYVKSQDTSNIANNVSAQAGSGYSINTEYRLGSEKEYRLLARYDAWTPKAIPLNQTAKKEDRGYILGAAWEQNKNVQWVANVTVTDNQTGSVKAGNVAGNTNNNGTAYMLTAEVKF